MSEQNNNRNESKKSIKELIALGLVVVSAAGIAGYRHVTEPGNHKVTEIVQANDNPTTVVQRAEDQFGKDPADFNVAEAAYNVNKQYGMLHVGDKVAVDVK